MTLKTLTSTYASSYVLGTPITNYAGGTLSRGNNEPGDWIGDPGLSTDLGVILFEARSDFENAAAAASVDKTKIPKLTTLVSFNYSDGYSPRCGLIADAAGDLFGATVAGGAEGYGEVFEIAKTKHGYASAPTILASFTGADGSAPDGGLIADAAGDLFGTTVVGGADGDGTVFEIAKTKHGYASAPTTLVSFTGTDGRYPVGNPITDAAGDLFGVTGAGGAEGYGEVFEIAKTKRGYASAPTTLVSFTGTDGSAPVGSLISDAAGDLFGTTEGGGAHSDGTVFEIAKTKHGYASAPTTLVSFTGTDGANPYGSLIADAAGDLFGATLGGGADDRGTVFEIAKTPGGYASATTLVSFTGTDGAIPFGGLIADAAGNLFGTTSQGGADDHGTVFEIAKTQGGYASAPTILVSFTGADGEDPQQCSLTIDAAGDLFGTTSAGGLGNSGTVFEVAKTKGGYALVQPVLPATPAADITLSLPAGSAFVQAMASHGASGSGSSSPKFLDSQHETRTLLARPQLA